MSVKINMTPLVDVCMSLLIVFLVSGSLIIQPALKIKVPEAVINEEKEETDKIIIYVSSDGRFAVDDNIVQLESIPKLLEKKMRIITSKMVLIKADKDAVHGNLLKMMSLSKKNGAKKITIATSQKKAIDELS